jgi:hypothetical protein
MGWVAKSDGHEETNRIRAHRLRRSALRRAALRYAAHGWDVVPGACDLGRRFDCGRPACNTVACHPAVEDWESVATSSTASIAQWWRDLPYTVLLATGRSFDVIDVPESLGRLAMHGRPEVELRGPLAVGTDRRWMFLVRPGHGLRPELLGRTGIVLHGYGSWVPAPPSPQGGGRVAWKIPPGDPSYRLGDPYVVQLMLARALRSTLGQERGNGRGAHQWATEVGQHVA